MNLARDAAPHSIRVLVADDDRSFLVSLRELIDRQPELEVVATAVDGLQAIELADDLDPDAVVLDVHMPLLDGVSAAARLRRDHPSICLIALTGDEAPALHQAMLDAGGRRGAPQERDPRRPRRAPDPRASRGRELNDPRLH